MVYSLSLLIALLSIFCSLILWLIFGKSSNRLKKTFANFPGPFQFPLIGSAYVLAKDTTEVMSTLLSLQEKYGSRVALRLMSRHSVLLGDPKDIEKVLSSTVNINRTVIYDTIKPWIGDGLLLSKDGKWHSHRKLITPTFHFRILNNYIHTFNHSSKILVDILEHVVERKEASIDLFPYINRCALESICGTATGVNTDSQNLAPNQTSTASEYGRAVHRFTELVTYRSYRPWLEIPGLWRLTSQGRESLKCEKILLDFTENLLIERKKQRKAEFLSRELRKNHQTKADEDKQDTGRKTSALLDLLLDIQEKGPNELSNEDLLAELNTFIFTGQDTTTAHVSWTLILLGSHSEHQERVREELDNIFGNDPSRNITPADLTQMKYMELCMKESLRLFPPAPFMMREVKSDIELDDKTIIPAGGEVTIFPFGIHRNPDLFPQPNEFDPERFTLENCVNRHAFSYIPFSAGPRNCIGQKFAMMEAKVMLAYIFRNFRVETITPLSDIKVMYASVIKPVGSAFRLHKRE